MDDRSFGIDGFWLKLLAIAAMTLDHIGCLFFPGVAWLRAVGRLTFPIMAFLIAEGYRHTRDVKRYEMRLFWFALISAVPFYMAFGWAGNVFFTLLCGLLALDFAGRMERGWKRAAVVLGLAVLSLPCDWGFSGVLAIYVFGQLPNKRLGAACGTAVLLATGMLKDTVLTAVLGAGVYPPQNFAVQSALLLAVPALMLYNGQRGWKMKHFFYIYYPAHLAILAVAAYFI